MRDALFVAEEEKWGEVLVQSVRRADSFVSRARGLTFRRRLGEDEGLWLVNRAQNRLDSAITMLFVFFPIGVLWLDRENQIVDKTVARPFRPIYVPKAPAISRLECQPRVLEKVMIGDRIRFVPFEESDEA